MKRPEVDEADVTAEIEGPLRAVRRERVIRVGEQTPYLRPPSDVEPGGGQDHDEEHEVVEREDTKSAAAVEVAEVAGSVQRANEDSGYEKPGEREEDVDTEPKRINKSA